MLDRVKLHDAAILALRNKQAEQREWAKLMLSVGMDKQAVANALRRSVSWVEYRMREVTNEQQY